MSQFQMEAERQTLGATVHRVACKVSVILGFRVASTGTSYTVPAHVFGKNMVTSRCAHLWLLGIPSLCCNVNKQARRFSARLQYVDYQVRIVILK